MSLEFELPFRLATTGDLAEITQQSARDREQRVRGLLDTELGDVLDDPTLGHVTWEGRTNGVPAAEVQLLLDTFEPTAEAIVNEGIPDLRPGQVTDRLDVTVPDDTEVDG